MADISAVLTAVSSHVRTLQSWATNMCPRLRDVATAPEGGITQPRTNFDFVLPCWKLRLFLGDDFFEDDLDADDDEEEEDEGGVQPTEPLYKSCTELDEMALKFLAVIFRYTVICGYSDTFPTGLNCSRT